MEPVEWASLAITAVLLVFGYLYGPKAYPTRIKEYVDAAAGLTTLVCTTLKISIFPVLLPSCPLWTAIGLVSLALLPPFIGLAESEFRRNGQRIYSTGRLAGTSNRFWGHLCTNAAGALATAGLVTAAGATQGFPEFVADFSCGAAFNVMLPLATIIVLSFVRWQQLTACPDVDERARLNRSGWDPASTATPCGTGTS